MLTYLNLVAAGCLTKIIHSKTVDNNYVPSTILADRENLNIYVNRPWAELSQFMDSDDRLAMVILNKVDF